METNKNPYRCGKTIQVNFVSYKDEGESIYISFGYPWLGVDLYESIHLPCTMHVYSSNLNENK